ncbi:MFS transporter, partial [Frankia sp. Cpl3]|nr:MFS transporter [Frankia sp. Cpl3]
MMALMMPISGRLFDKVGALPLGLVGLTIMGITTYELHTLAADTPNKWVEMIMTIRGMGIGLCMMPLSTAGTNAIPVHLINKASPLSNVTRQIMGSFGISILTTVMSMRQTFHASV